MPRGRNRAIGIALLACALLAPSPARAVGFRVGAFGTAYAQWIAMGGAVAEVGPFQAQASAGYYFIYKSPMYSVGGRVLFFETVRPFLGVDFFKCPGQVESMGAAGLLLAGTSWLVPQLGLHWDITKHFTVGAGFGNILLTRFNLYYLTFGYFL